MLGLELTARGLGLDALDGIPVVVDSSGAHRLMATYEGHLRAGKDPVAIRTDALGLRVASLPSRASEQIEVLVIGDRAAGLHLAYESTPASILVRQLGGDHSRSALLAAEPQDPEALTPWVRDYATTHRHRHRLIVLVLNVADDLDEVYFGRSVRWVPTESAPGSILRASAFVRWAARIKNTASRPPEALVSAGLNMSMLLLDGEERSLLVGAYADAVEGLLRELPPHDDLVVAVLPPDSMVSMTCFARHRPEYDSDDAYQRALKAQATAVGRLETAMDELKQRLDDRRIAHVFVLEELKTLIRAAPPFDATGQPTAAAQRIVADKIVVALRR